MEASVNFIRRLKVETLWRMMRRSPCAVLVGPWPCLVIAQLTFPRGKKANHTPFATLRWQDYETGIHHEVALFHNSVAEVLLGDDGTTIYVRRYAESPGLPNPLPIRFLAIVGGEDFLSPDLGLSIAFPPIKGAPATGQN